MLTEKKHELSIEQSGSDCIVTMHGQTKRIPNCNAITLANTMWDKPGEHYTLDQMEDFGFAIAPDKKLVINRT